MLLLRADKPVEPLPGRGSLLRIFPEEDFEPVKVQLRRGDRLLVYSDGAEDALCRADGGDPKPAMAEVVAPWALLPCDQFLLQLGEAVQATDHPNNLDDDITAIVVDIKEDSGEL